MKSIAVIVATLSAGLLFASPVLAECSRTGGKVSPPTVVKFAVDSTAVNELDRKKLVDIAERTRDNPNMKICVIGQADKQGDAAYNETLALNRAQAVADILAGNGVPRRVLDISGRGEAFGDDLFGALKPADADRRVEVLVIRY